MATADRRPVTVTFTGQQLEVIDQLVAEGTHGTDRETVIRRLLGLYAQERLGVPEGARS